MHRLLLSFVFFRVVPWRSALAAATLALSMNLVGLVGGARAATLEGFEPIKFGMTMEQARAALSNQTVRPKSEGFFEYRKEPFFDEASLQTIGNFLLYKIFVESMNLHFDVRQTFREGRAAEVSLHSLLLPKGLERCITAGRSLARGIGRNHGVSPRFRPGKLEESFPGIRPQSKQVIEHFVFVFGRGASIELMTWWMSGDNCAYSIFFQPPGSGIAFF